MNNQTRKCLQNLRPAMMKLRIIILACLCIVLIVVCLTGQAIYQQRADRPEKTPFNSMADAGGYKLYINCSGKPVAGRPTVLLEAGANSTSETWRTVLPDMAKFAHVCAYDRAGLGKSEPSPLSHRTGLQMVNDLHRLLAKAGIAGPYILVGHSFGGLIVRLYASRYPEEVAGIVLVDSIHEDETGQWLALIPPEVRKELEAAGGARVMGGEGIDLQESTRQMRAVNWRTDIPLIVLSRGRASFNPDDYPPPLRSFAPQGEALRIRMQEDLARRSTNGKLIWAEKSGHMIHQDQPELVVDAVRRLIEATGYKDGKKF